MEQEDEKEFVALAKEIIQKCNLNTRVDRLTDCRDKFFVLLYKGLIGDNLKGLISYPVIHNEHIHNCQSVIDSLANDVLNVDLTHISAKGIVDGDTLSIKNLLEIFSGLLEYFLECIDENQSDSEDGLDDSNVITSQHDVISSLLKEEFGTSHRDESRQEKSTESMAKPTSATSRPATSSLYNRTNQRTARVPAEPSLRFSSYSGLLSGHEADTSEVSDSTNELIKLGESSSSGNSSIKRPVPVNLSHQKEPAKRTWKQSVSDADNHQELTQYTISSDEGDSSSLQNNKNQSSDHFSSSFVSSTSSWRQQISPLDADDNGVKLDTIGLRPKVDNVGEPGKDGNEDGSSSGRSTPVLHHHYHHHYHHPTDPRVSRAGNVSSSRHDNFNDYRNIPGNIKTSAVASSTHPNKAILPGAGAGGISKVPDYIPGQLARGDLPGTFDYTSRGTGHPGIGTSRYTRDTGNLLGQGISNLPLTDYSRLGLTGQTVASSLPTNSLPAYKTTAGSVLSGQGYGSQRIPTTEHSKPSLVGQYVSRSDPGYSRSITGTTSSTSTRALLEQSQAVPGTSGLQTTGPSIYTTTRTTSTTLPRHTSIPGTTSILDPSRLRTSAHDGRHGVSTSIPVSYATTQPGLTSSSQLRGTTAATATETSSLYDQYLSRVTPLTTTTSLPSSSGLLTVSSGGYSDVFTDTNKTNQYIPTNKSMDSRKARDPQELQRILPSQINMVSTARKDDDQPPGLLKEDVLAENTRHNHRDDDNDDYSDDDARYSDSAIDYNRGGDQVDSENEFSEDSILRRIHDRWKNLKTSKSTKPAARRGVTFNEDIQTIPITNRMDRLRRLLEDEAEEQRQQTASIRDVYAEQLQDIQKQQQQERKEMTKKKVQKTPLVSKKKTKKPVPSKQRGRLEAVYRPQGRPGRPVKRHAVKTRKRSASASPVARRKRKTSIADFHETLLPSLFEEFPFLHVSPQTTHAMWQKQARQISLLSKSETTALKTKSQRRVEEAEKRQERLLKILHKELEHNQRMRGERERQDHQRTITAKVNEKRQVAARARRYYDEYQLRMRAKMLKRRTREEQILKKLFDDGLEIQKQRVRELRKYAKDKNEAIEQKQSNEIESLENYYKDQFSILAEDMTRERHELKVRQNAQEKVMRQMRHELRKKMEKEIEDLQETLTRDEDSAYFRQLEADRLRREFQLAMYKSDL